ncbi:precorrin-2 dehydrogenase/sirohydrochlorin ferrochelatase [Methanocalculus alkaliphilus]|uniref:precorrin-2 dehydrogenase/sirohydrochlorin ferrochelatase family protein n=1 Tax=Methanocalculus alkaliphilus TaxID=768730 RepID=UPI0020A14097|nr:bifunctional precorrin-2 dehydrogenase/sirohydrochlorin ferrochelatase [Methanocalculus alkaliphilus]MCP1715414.1 precorrin-2 dehydrogenase/sirohydrochlorin ferrochelatase [Methanocalculus alkaliphilus]
MIPLIIDCTDKKVIIFGGGTVATRKARYFAGEADVSVISRSFSDPITDLPITQIEADISRMHDDEIRAYLRGAFLTIAATSSKAINDRIGGIAAEEGCLFNNADGRAGDVMIPSMVRGENLIIGFATSGGSPVVARLLRERFEAIAPETDAMIDLQRTLREALKKTDLPEEERRRRLREAAEDPEITLGLTRARDETIRSALLRYAHE